jgi:hypothetical protein
MTALPIITKGRPNQNHRNQDINTPVEVQPNNTGFVASNVKRNVTSNLKGPGDALVKAGSRIMDVSDDYERQAAAERKFAMEGAMKIADKQDTNAVNRLVDNFRSSTEQSFGNAKQSKEDFTEKESVQNFNKSIDDARQAALNDPSVRSMSEVARLDLESRLHELNNKSMDGVNAHSLLMLNKQGEDRFHINAAQQQDETSVDAIFAKVPDPIGHYIKVFSKLASQSVGTVDQYKQLAFQKEAVQLAQDTVFEYHMRNSDLDAAEESLEHVDFNLVDGSTTNLEHRKRIREARQTAPIEVYDEEQGMNIFVAQSEMRRNPSRFLPKRNMAKVNNQKQFSRAMIENEKKSENDPTKLAPADIRTNFGIVETVSDVEKDLRNIGEVVALIKDPGEQAAVRSRMMGGLDEKYIPLDDVDKARQKAQAEAAEIREQQKILETQASKNKENDAVMVQLQEKFRPVQAVEEKFTNAVQRILGTVISGKQFKVGENPVLDNEQKALFNKVGAAAELYKKSHRGAGAWESIDAVIQDMKDIDPDILNRNVFTKMADDILGRREGKTGEAAAPPTSSPIPNAKYNNNDLNAELNELLKSRKAIDLDRATGIGSGLSAFLTNLPGQLFDGLQDQETIRARTALLRVSREILTLTMKNDRFAIAEQVVLSDLLSGPKLLTDANSIKTKLTRFQSELKIEIARSSRNIKKGINAGAELDKLIDLDRIDTMIDQFDLTPPLAAATPESIKGSSSNGLNDLQKSATEESLKDDPEKLNALIARQEQEIEKLGIGGTSSNVGPAEELKINNTTEANPNISPAVQTAISNMDEATLLKYADTLADMLGNRSGTEEELVNMEALLKDIDALINPTTEAQ